LETSRYSNSLSRVKGFFDNALTGIVVFLIDWSIVAVKWDHPKRLGYHRVLNFSKRVEWDNRILLRGKRR
jgi:hypothetical protein